MTGIGINIGVSSLGRVKRGTVVPATQLDFDADVGVTETGTISAWADQSANSYNVAQGTGANQPAYNDPDATFNGHASSQSADSTDILTRAAAVTNLLPTSSGLSASFVISSTSASTSAELLFTVGNPSGTNTVWQLTLAVASTGLPRFNVRNSADTAGQSVDWTSDIRDGDAHIVDVYYSDADDEIGIRVDGGAWQTASATSHNTSTAGSMTLHAGVSAVGPAVNSRISRIRVWNQVLTDAQFNLANAQDADRIPA